MKAREYRRWVEIDKVFVYYDGPELFLAKGAQDRLYVFVAVRDGEYFGSPVAKETLKEYLAERADLLYLLKSSTDHSHYVLRLRDSTKDLTRFSAKRIKPDEVPNEWWPERGFFASAHTEPDDVESSTQEQRQDLRVGMAGRWDAADLGAYPDRLIDAYSFMHALNDDRQTTLDIRKRAFQRYPWRGGISTVGFFESLYRNVPRVEKLRIEELSYHSPGHITVAGLESVVDRLHRHVAQIMEDYDKVRAVYRELHNGMSERQLLGKSRYETVATARDLLWVEQSVTELANALRFSYLKRVQKLVDNDWVMTAKILMSYYRRIEDLADFYSTGKATYLGKSLSDGN